MKKLIILSIFTLFITNDFFAQSANKFTNDEKARIQFSVHLITYDTISAFDNAKGEAYYTMLINVFTENLAFPDFIPSELTSNDRNKIEGIIQQLEGIKQNPPTWESLYKKQTEFLIWIDIVTRKRSKYKN